MRIMSEQICRDQRFLSFARAGVLIGLSLLPLKAQDGSVTSLNNSPWKVAPQGNVTETGEQLSTPGYAAGAWLTAHVPGTAFGDHVIAGLEPDPNFGQNVWTLNRKKYDQNFWYRTDFTVPGDYFQGGRIWLNLDGVHRDGDVYVNGTMVGSMLGFFQRGRFDVTALMQANGTNSLAVLAHLMVVPDVKGPDGQWNFNVSSPSLLCSRGWDWMPRVPGLNTGILKDVYLTHTGEVSIIDPWIRTDLPNLTEADLTIQTQIANSSASAVTGELAGEINPGHLTFARTVTLNPGETRTITLAALDTPALHIGNPALWWPNGYGDANLNTCHLEFRTGTAVSDRKDVTFGIRKYTYQVANNVLCFYINGTRLFLKGGSWGLPEYLMRNRTAADYDTRVRFHKEQNFNIIRNWMGSVPDAAFYDACDRYGIMVWDEFWLNRPDGNPGDIPVYHANATEKVKQLRNHPSIAFWCAMNEGTPPPEVNDPLAEIIRIHDGDDRRYQPCSNSGNLSGSGPWTNFDPPVYFRGTFSFDGTEKPPVGEAYGLRSELGSAAFTSIDSFSKFMPQATWWPRNETWNRHYFGPRARNALPDNYQNKLATHYGAPSDAGDFCRKAQLLNQETMKAMFEGWLDHSDQTAAGLIIWMSHPAYPCFVWQTYDYYYDTTGAYWGAKTACEPVHIFWNSNDGRIRVSNTSGKSVENLHAELRIHNLDGTEKSRQTATVNAPYNAVTNCFTLTAPAGLSPTHFLKLRLTDAAGNLVSENFYWRGTSDFDYSGLSDLMPVNLAVTAPTSGLLANGMIKMTMNITNPADSGTVAFAIRPKPVKPGTDEQILPVFMNDGYFSLTPGETKQVTIEYHPADAAGLTPDVMVECWNNFPHTFPDPGPGPDPVPDPGPDSARTAWNGGASTDWATAGNWDVNILPSATVSALFNSTFSNLPQLAGNATTQGIWLASGVGQDVAVTAGVINQTLFITGNATLSGQTNAGIILDDSENHNLTVGGTTALAITLTNSTGFYVNNEGTLSLPSTGKALTIGTVNTLTLGGTTSGGNVSIANTISGNGSVMVNTAGTVTLGGPNTHTGGTTLTAGTLNINHGKAVGTAASTFTINGGTLDNTSAAAITFSNINPIAIGGNFAFAGTKDLNLGTGAVALGGATRTITANAGTLMIGGVISGGGIIKEGAGVLSLSGSNTCSGTTTVVAGTLNLRNTNALQYSVLALTGGTVSFGTSTTSGLTSMTLGGLDGPRNVNLNNFLTVPTAVNLTIGNNNGQNPVYSGALGNPNGAAKLTKIGSNTQTLAGANTYTGITLVTEGTLALAAGSENSPITVNNAAALGFTLGSSITSTSSVTLNTGAKIKITGTPTSPASHTLITAAGGIAGTPELETTIPGYTLALESGDTVLKLNFTGFASNYNSWANDPAKGNIPGEPPDGDYDNDGISNLMEYALGKNPRVSSQPTGFLSGNSITFSKGPDAIANADVSWTIETSTTLAAGQWTAQVSQPAGDPTATISYTYNPGTRAKSFARLKVTQH